MEQSLRHIRLLAELRDLAEHRQILIRHFEWGSHDQKEEIHRLLVYRAKVEPVTLSPKCHLQLAHDERPAMGNRDCPANSGGAEVFAALEHLEEHALGLVIELEEPDELFKDLILGRSLELQLDRVLGKKLPQLHPSLEF